MSVIGFDIGNENCVIAAAKRGGIDVLLNDEAKRESPGVVSFGDKQRFLGSAGAAFATANPKSTISQIKRLIGRQYKEESVQQELKLLPFVTTEGPRGGIMIELEYMKEKQTFTPVEILGMLFKHLKEIAEKSLESAVLDCVIGIPSYFTDLQRREYIDAASIAGLNTLLLMHDGTAIALGYGMYKSDLSDKGATIVVFVDIGHCDTQVTVAAFERGGMKVLSHASDPNLGGRDFDEVLFKHFADKFNEQHNIDVYSNIRACVRLRASCEKLKKVLSANTEAPISIECLIGDTDVKGSITREEFEKLSRGLLKRVAETCVKAVNESGIKFNKICTIEVVGSGSRVPAITKYLTELFNKEPTRTLNASECVARGCALCCAMLSPTQHVRDYQVRDCFPYSIGFRLDEGNNIKNDLVTAIPKRSLFPAGKTSTHLANTTFFYHVSYINKTDLPAGVSPEVGLFMMGPSHTSGTEEMKVHVRVGLNKHGIVEIKFATELEDERSSFMGVLLNPIKPVAKKPLSDIAVSDNLDASTTKDELLKAKEREQKLLEHDKKVEHIKDQRNTLESFVYDTRNKLQNAYKKFVKDSENEEITKSLQETEDWLYDEDSDDDECDEQIYTGKLQSLQKLLEPIEIRYTDENKVKASKPLLAMIEEYRLVAESLPDENKMELLKKCTEVEQHLSDQSHEKYDLIGWSNFIKEAMGTFKRVREAVEIKAEAKKPLLAMIEKYCVVADSIPLENKTKLENACEEVEQYLKSYSPEKYDPIVWSNFITKTMDKFKRICEEAIRYKPSIPKHVEPVNNNIKDEITKPLISMINEYLWVADSLHYENKMKLINACTEVDQYLSRNSLKNYDRMGWANFINETMSIFESRCKEAMQYNTLSPEYPGHVESGQSCNNMDPQIGDPLEAKQTAKSMGEPVERNPTGEPLKQGQTNEPVKQGQTNEPVKQGQTSKPVKQGQTKEPVKQGQTSKSVKQGQTNEPVKQDQTSKPVKQGQTNEPVKQGQTSKPVKQGQTNERVKQGQTNEAVKQGQTSKPVKQGQTNERVKQGQTNEPVKQGQTNNPVDGNQTGKPMKSDQPTKPMDGNQVCKPVKQDPTSEPSKPDETNKPVKTEQTSETVSMGQPDKPFGSEQDDIPDHMEVDEGCISP